MFNPEKIAEFPEKPGVYIMKDKRGRIIYIGKAVSLKNRVRSYFQSPKNLPVKVASMVPKIENIEYIVTDSEVEALILECNLIKFNRPKYNILLRDDKQYPYIKIATSQPFPRLEVVRRVKKDGARYFGPYADVGAMREAIDVINKVFPIRSCKKDLSQVPLKERPCLNYYIKRCLAPCQGSVEQEEYDEMIKNIIMFLEGKQETLIKQLREKMEEEAAKLDFEKAAILRDQISALQKVLEEQKIVSTDMTDQDIIAMARGIDTVCIQVFFVREGKLVEREPFILSNTKGAERKEILTAFVKQFYNNTNFIPKEIIIEEEIDDKTTIQEWLYGKKGSKVYISIPKRGEKKKLAEMVAENARIYLEQIENKDEREKLKNMQALEELQKYLGLKDIPHRIEAFDISNTQGTESVASMVVFEEGQPKKEDYRKFKIKTVEGPNDFESMREVIFRRFKRAILGDEKFNNLPDLLLIDGGKGQLRYVREALRELGLESIFTIGLAKEFEHIFVEGKEEPIVLPEDSEALYLVQRVRDEAHRFAITFHRSLRSKRNLKSALDDIPGIGKARRLALFKTFGSLEGIRQASVEELAGAPGMNKKAAQAVYDHFH
ncbi:UvrABC system protein C [Tepidanaerobacter syntrophicus]|uniref:excinuclease ABC subunit UvrC n=1 Tax=Tepidanaerobacter syntrophicus TaxID=224999 RepID=UPI0022ED5EBE|nr:excinuclease ABC subunit UvrC [Tepidanaerobacter syntrophicus]GLI19704.1 UvrABC system protein C [Tepidanaerobacter syntrophicus]GLI50409.1 UvrABC system protein C [Tepidanaerobacter syntrophicus]